MEFKIKEKLIGYEYPTYFIAEIGSNFDQDLERAKYLIKLAKDSGADAAKFSTLHNESYVNELGFQPTRKTFIRPNGINQHLKPMTSLELN